MTKLCTATTLAMITRLPHAQVRLITHPSEGQMVKLMVESSYKVVLYLIKEGRNLLLTDNSDDKPLTDIWDMYFKPDAKGQKQQVSFSPFRSCRGAAPVWWHESASRQVIPIRVLKGCPVVRGVTETESVAEVKEMCVCLLGRPSAKHSSCLHIFSLSLLS